MDQVTASTLPIGEVARLAGIRPSALRYYESVGVLPKPRRVGGRRRYERGILGMLRFVARARAAGFTIAEIKKFRAGFGRDVLPWQRWQSLVRQKLAEIDAVIARANEMKRVLEGEPACRCVRLEDCPMVERS